MLGALALPLRALPQEIRFGSEFQVNTYTTDYQYDPSVAADDAGRFVVIWASAGQDGSNYGIFARRFASTGVPLASEFRVNAYTINKQLRPSVAMDADGDFVVVWISYAQGGPTSGVFARRFSSAGALLATEFQVNTFSNSDVNHPSVAVDTDGDFAVAWDAFSKDGSMFGVFARRFTSAGAPLASEFQVNTYTQYAQRTPSVAAGADGKFVVVWQSYEQEGSSSGVFARRFSSAGTPLASEFQVNTYTTDTQSYPSVAADPDGDFVVAWQSYNQDGEQLGVFARRFSSAGASLAGELQVNTYTVGFQNLASVAASVSGDFVVAWQSFAQDGQDYGVFARRFSSAGAPLASEFQVNTYTTSFQYRPSLTTDADGDFVVVWPSFQDGSNTGIFAQRILTSSTLDLDGDGSAEPLTDGLLLLRYLFGFRGTTLTTGAVGLGGCTRCDAASIEAYLAGIVPPQSLAENVRLGSEFQVNGYTANQQTLPSVAVAANGGFAVAWSSVYQDGDNTGVFARRFSMAGAALATEFQVNSSTVSFQSGPSVATDGVGRFVVAWNSFYQDYSSYGVFARRFASAGAPLASEFQVNSYTSFSQFLPSVAAGASGAFVVAWESGQDGQNNGVFARFLSTSGATLGSEFQVNTYTTGGQRYPSLATAADGDFVVVWESVQDGLGTNGIFARRFSSAGTALAGEFQVNTYTASGQDRASVAASTSGDFLVAWQSFGQDGSSHGVFARRFSSAGTPQNSEFQVNTTTTNMQSGPSVAADANGRFVIAWQDSARDGAGAGVFARRVSSTGAPVASEFQVNTTTAGDQVSPAVSADGVGHLVIAWQDSVKDGSSYGVFAQRYVTAVLTMDLDGDGAIEPLTDGLLVLRYLFGFRGTALVNGAVGAGCGRCDAPAIEAYIAGLTA